MSTLVHRLGMALPALVLMLFVQFCKGASEVVDFEAMTRLCHSVITNRTCTDAELLEAISRLGKTAETPRFWTQVANDSTYGILHRKRCIMALFRRHARDCETIADLGPVLGRRGWLTNSSIDEVGAITGWIPVDVVPGDTIFLITILPGSTPEERSLSAKLRCAVYVRVSGKVLKETFDAFLRDGGKVGGNAFIQQFGLIDDYEAWLRAPSKRPSGSQRNANRAKLR